MKPADTLERDLARTLAAKADQVELADPPATFDDDRRRPAVVIHLSPPRSHLRRAVLAAAVGAAVVGVVVAGVARQDDPRVAVGNPPAVGASGATGEGPLAFLPGSVPEGWVLDAIDAGPGRYEEDPQHWQLFGPADAAPVTPGVLVGTAPRGDRVIDHADATVHGAPTRVDLTSPDPTHPAGAITAQWIEGDLVHDAVAVGMSGDDLVAFLDGLVAPADPATGFDAPPGAVLPEVGTATVAGSRGAAVTYGRDGDPAQRVVVSTTSTDPYGGLLHRLDGTAGPDGWALVRRLRAADGPSFVSATRSDGWTVDVWGSEGVDPATLDTFLGSLRPATGEDLIDLARAQPVTARYAIGDRTVEVHGTRHEDVGLCLSGPDEAPVCSTAEVVRGDPPVIAASLVVDGRWVVVTVGGDEALEVQTAPADPGQWADHDPEELSPAARDDGAGVGLFEVPAGTEAVEAVEWSGDLGSGVHYDDPLS